MGCRGIAALTVWMLLAGCGNSGASGLDFTNLRAEEITGTRAVIRFDTSRPTTCEARYGTLPDALTLTATDPNMDEDNPFSIEHEVPLDDLEPLTTYYVRAFAEDEAGETFTSELMSFTTREASAVSLGTNVALPAAGAVVVEVSSNFGGAANDETWGAESAFDGEMSTAWATDGDGDAAFVVVDLRTARTISGFAFRSRDMADGSSIIRSVTLTLDGREIGSFATPDPTQLYPFELEEPVTGRIVRIDAVETTGGNTGAREIEIYEAGE